MAVVLMAVTSSARAEPVSSVPVADPARAAVERGFLASLPPDDSTPTDDSIDPSTLASIVALNPGRDADVRAALLLQARCRNDEGRFQALASLAAVARALPLSTLVILTEFYAGPVYHRFVWLSELPSPNASEAAELAAIVERHRLQAFADATQVEMREMVARVIMQGPHDRCRVARDTALDANRLKHE